MKLTIKNKFGVTPNELLNNPEISFKAKGLYAYIQSKPDGWDFSADRIKNDTKESKDAINTGLQELEEHGYLERNKTRSESGKFEWEYVLHSQPIQYKPEQAQPERENPSKENTANNKERSIKKEIIKKNNNTGDASLSPHGDVVQLIDFFKKNINPHINFGNKTERRASAQLIELYGLEKTIEAMEFLEARRKTDKYLPIVTTPFELFAKWAKIKQYLEAKKTEQVGRGVTI